MSELNEEDEQMTVTVDLPIKGKVRIGDREFPALFEGGEAYVQEPVIREISGVNKVTTMRWLARWVEEGQVHPIERKDPMLRGVYYSVAELKALLGLAPAGEVAS